MYFLLFLRISRFDIDASHAICKDMGHNSAQSWNNAGSGSLYPNQHSYIIKIDDVSCSSHNWADCSYRTHHNCGHYEDVLLTCSGYYSTGIFFDIL